MSLDAIITLSILVAFLVTALSGRLAVDFALAAAMTALMVFGVLLPEEALQGFSNPAIYNGIGALCTGGVCGPVPR